MVLLTIGGCKKKEESPPIAGTPGNPRFNLQFTNQSQVDLDLYVRTPNSFTISYVNPAEDGGQLDVDCRCSACPNGPNENIFWQDGTAPRGTYTFWVQYYETCSGGANASSKFTLRRMKNSSIEEEYTGTCREAVLLNIRLCINPF